ncbi:protein FAR1-RELATED SEQUENCE 5-like [Silene latifolia]|uniref:protein FAR1-RELATED SEQUENCE 5-like n=1 Tax=Silene latifolia TaxID=37657 RepID=UPI003D788DA0
MPLGAHQVNFPDDVNAPENNSVVHVVPVPTPQCIDVDEVHAGNRLSVMVTPGGSEEWVRNIATEFTPTIGQTFATLHEGIQFYETYAIACGFEPRKSSTKRFRSSGDIRTKLIVCHREGFRDSKPTILPITGEEEEQMVKAYNPKKTKVNIGPTSTFRPVKEYVDGYENIGACLTDFKNFGREIKCFICLKDAQIFVDQLETLHETQEGFYYAYDIDQNKCLFRVFWADAAACRNYALYGEAVTFDPTYSTNKYDMIFAPFTGVDHHKKSVTFGASLMSRENDQNFKWIFTKFLDCMGGKEPHCFFTDQCPAMKIAVPATFTTFANRYCMWHIMKKLPEKLGTTDSDLEPSDFEERWFSLISEFQLEDNAWLKYQFSKRQRWIPAYYRDIPLGCLLRTTQRSESENSFFKRFENPHGTLVEFWMCFQSAMDQQTKNLLTEIVITPYLKPKPFLALSAGDSSRDGSTRFLDVEDSIFHKTYTVAFNPSTFDATCSCKMFERKGYIYKHIIWILSGKGVKKIPDKYLLSRWTKNTKKMPLYDVHGQLLDDFNSLDVTKLQISTVWSEFYSTLTLLKSLPENHINELTSLLKTFRQNFKPGAEKLTKQQELEMLLGVKSSSEVHILPPVQSKNKGSGKRLMSNKDQSIAKAQKPIFFCNNCKQMAHHDKRNCPNPAVDTSQHSFDHESDIYSLVDSD